MNLTRLLTVAGAAALLAGTAYAQSTDATTAVDADGNVIETHRTVDPNVGVTHETTAQADVRGHMEGTPAPTATTLGATTRTGAYSATTVGVPASGTTTYSTGATMTTRLVTNGPVPDTRENRAKYGQPLSRAGRATTPAGN